MKAVSLNNTLTQRIQTLPHQPGVYQMLNEQGETLYVGKARDLKKRVNSYFRKIIPDPKTAVLVQQIFDVQITVTQTETEALLLECNLIKQLKPRYNVLLRDDKSYPYIFIDDSHDFPRMDLVRGQTKGKGRYFGPFPNASAARYSLRVLQKTFLLRQCRDTFFQARTRPCLQYQIKRCTAPCVDLINKSQYQQDVSHATLFLEGKDEQVISALVEKMDAASAEQVYEQAAHYRDQIAMLRKIQAEQYMTGFQGDTDVVVAAFEQATACVELLSVRQGHLLGSRSYFPKGAAYAQPEEVLGAFIGQHYLTDKQAPQIPERIIVNHTLADQTLLEQTLTKQAGRAVKLQVHVRGERARWQQMALMNAETALTQRLKSEENLVERFNALQEDLQLPGQANRIECFDVSHTQGEATVASCVVFGPQGAIKSDYRRFNIRDITPGDDYAALQQALTRRYTKLKTSEGVLPDIIIIDGGKGQLSAALHALEELQLTDLTVLGMAKGPARKSGLEVIWQHSAGQAQAQLISAKGRLLLEAVRDEAHRFAIMAHRKQRAKARQGSVLDDIPGLGAVRRRTLLRHFGGLSEVRDARIESLAKVPGISQALAKRIYEALHPIDT